VESNDPYAVLSDCLTAVRGVNKTDVLTLSSTFGSLKNIIDCSMEELSLCPGLGARKVKNLYETFHAPLDPTKKKRQKTESQIESFLHRKVRRSGGGAPTPAAATAASAKGKEKADDADDEAEASQ
jgi:DNA excision repair protein ERCC-1